MFVIAIPAQPVFDDLVPEGERFLEKLLQIRAPGGFQSVVHGTHAVNGPDGLPDTSGHQTLLD